MSEPTRPSLRWWEQVLAVATGIGLWQHVAAVFTGRSDEAAATLTVLLVLLVADALVVWRWVR